jgi:hypothetical protein
MPIRPLRELKLMIFPCLCPRMTGRTPWHMLSVADKVCPPDELEFLRAEVLRGAEDKTGRAIDEDVQSALALCDPLQQTADRRNVGHIQIDLFSLPCRRLPPVRVEGSCAGVNGCGQSPPKTLPWRIPSPTSSRYQDDFALQSSQPLQRRHSVYAPAFGGYIRSVSCRFPSILPLPPVNFNRRRGILEEYRAVLPIRPKERGNNPCFLSVLSL